MQGNYFLLKDLDEQKDFLDKFIKDKVGLIGQGKSVSVRVEEYKNPRSLSANALYWIWMNDLAKLFNSKGLRIEGEQGERDYDKDDCHDLMRTMFLGMEEKKLSKTVINKLKSTRKLNSSEFCNYMERIEEWSIDKLKHNLPNPVDNMYQKYLRKQNQ